MLKSGTEETRNSKLSCFICKPRERIRQNNEQSQREED